MLSMRNGFVVVGCVFVGFITSAGPGLVARAAEPPRWDEGTLVADGTSAPGTDDARRRIAQLEQRLKQLEAERRGSPPSAPTPRHVSAELGAAVARNHELMARNRELAAENQALAQSHLFEPPVTATACEPTPSEADPKAQLRYWADRLRDGDDGFRGRLTTEQNSALKVLLRPERALDPSNPWREL